MSRLIMDRKNTASRLRHRVTLQQPIEVSDGAGGYTLTWQDVAELWAQIEPLRGTEELQALQIKSEVVYRFTLRYREDITAEKRFTFSGKIFNIRSVFNVDMLNALVEIMVEEGVAT